MTVISIYDYFLVESLKCLSKIPLENQLKECIGLRILVLDYCGVVSKYFYKFADCDVFAIQDSSEPAPDLLDLYDVVYVAANELQHVSVPKPCLKIVCTRSQIQRIEVAGHIKSGQKDCCGKLNI
ncbi:uncharacterized protein VICG_00215 [Vittaforma corneae ATCC 50505]|uniref:Uncharacterized protein n=1 Tax=Vittaforma corneae (strain ATCC 50505) TaxID=993615 RepID=L2GQV8_VITCO|nr:uncharacterized protein VICG_00215 [Vittaforma corneae ATCC 50505]ELA42900.1 hypothetical protein VICG_00215 [Vittaforma corneae ATCC 50505]